MRFWKVLIGKHTERDGTVHVEGDVIASEHDYAVKFVNKFVEVPQPANYKAKVEAVVEVEGYEEEVEPDFTPDAEPHAFNWDILGEEVTKKFPLAEDNELRVFKKSQRFRIYKPDGSQFQEAAFMTQFEVKQHLESLKLVVPDDGLDEVEDEGDE